MSYITTKMLNLDLDEMNRVCHKMYMHIKENFTPDGNTDYSGQSTMTTKLYSQYNILTSQSGVIHDLYSEIRDIFREVCDSKEKHFIQSWLNFYRKGEFIDWHRHWPMQANCWHGFYCVSCEPSKTTYRLPPAHGLQIPQSMIEETNWETQDVESKNNLIVLSPSAGDMHRTWPWEYDEPRITIAFDIVPISWLEKTPQPKHNILNHWIPL